MSCVFKDDKPVECDCGCTVFSGWVNEATVTVMYRGKPKTVIFTYCDREECGHRAMFEKLDSYLDIEEHHIMTADDKENAKADADRD